MNKYNKLLALIIVLIIGATIAVIKIPTRYGLDIKGGTRVVLQAEMDKLPKDQDKNEAMSAVLRIMGNRVNGLGVSEALVQQKGTDQVLIEMPGMNKEGIIEDLETTARMEFRHFDNIQNARHPMAKYKMERANDAKTGEETFTFTDSAGKEVKPEQVIQESKLILTGADILPTSKTTINQQTNQPVVLIAFTKKGTEVFSEFTRKNVGETLAMILDGKILSAPSISEAITEGRAEITGMRTLEEAQRLADFLNAGALPVPLHVIQQETVEATIGAIAVTNSEHAGMIGLGLVVLFMLGYYLLPGLLAELALGVYALFTLAVFKLVGVTLTVPGIAAYIISIGMAVDANILIFERLKEELRGGKTLHAAIDAGFARAFTSILDSNVCTLITCAVLAWLGTGPIQGFAYVLALGVLLSMFTAITVTRTFLHLAENSSLAEKAGYFGLSRQWVVGQSGRSIDIVGRMMMWFGLSALVIVPGMIFAGCGGVKRGIDFTGGGFLQVQFQQPTTAKAIDSALTSIGLTGSMEEKGQGNTWFVRTRNTIRTRRT